MKICICFQVNAKIPQGHGRRYRLFLTSQAKSDHCFACSHLILRTLNQRRGK